MKHIINKNNTKGVRFESFGNTGISIAYTYANLKTVQELIQENNLAIIDYTEALLKMDRNPRLKEALKESWFYVKGVNSLKSGHYNFKDNFESTGDLISGKEEDAEKNVYVMKGIHTYPLSIDVHGDTLARNFGRRYILDSTHTPDRIASVVVGIENKEEGINKLTVTSTKNGVSLKGISKAKLLEQYKMAEEQLQKAEGLLGKENILDIKTFIDIFRRKD